MTFNSIYHTWGKKADAWLGAAPDLPDTDNTNTAFSVNCRVDIVQILLFAVSLVTRTWQLTLPRAVVFDELHFSKFVSLYVQKIFFFDYHPPLGKMLLAAVASYVGYHGNIDFDRIGAEYPPDMPVYQLRLVSAIFGSLLVPLTYQIAVEAGLSQWAGLFAGGMVLFDNGLLTQSRFILLDSALFFFILMSLLGLLKFRRCYNRPFSVRWFVWLILTGASLGFAVSTKYVGFFTALIVIYVIAKDFWEMLAYKDISDVCLLEHLCARAGALIVLPAIIYLSVFYVHLCTLTRAGPHDNIMSSAFQASLEGGLAAITKGQPLQVSYGSQITLRHTYGRPCWLHSHTHVYPIRYPDNRGSSHQQQVTCYSFKDIQNWWIVKHPNRDTITIEGTPRPVRHGDLIQLVHGITRRALNSHDVAAPLSPQCQEVSCYIDYNVSMPAQYLWKVDIVNRADDREVWQTIKSNVRLVHANTSYALKVSWKQLPEWGFNQLEVVTDKHINQQDTVWNVEEHRYTTTESEDPAKELSKAPLIPLQPTQLSFWEKFWEVQLKMIQPRPGDADAISEHKYSSSPLEWPLMTRNIAYWLSPTSNAQVHFLGNPAVWYTVAVALFLYLAILTFYLLRQRRAVYDIPKKEWSRFVFAGEIFLGGYFLHYLPFFLCDSTLFLYNYLPALLYGILLAAALVDHFIRVTTGIAAFRPCSVVVMTTLSAIVIWSFCQLSVFTYGSTQLSPNEIKQLQWLESWDFIVHKP
ncbi:protein O-mannosyl-transferase 1-like [Liolophura sinensis]|uniref:protein O-mannosyl-transferase 1-like n=1 Tax=Liolophura sinensis TaxID=3198878 RepID=UPI0031581B32